MSCSRRVPIFRGHFVNFRRWLKLAGNSDVTAHAAKTNFVTKMPVAGRGAFIVFEGCDKSGKSTQCSLLVEKLNEAGTKAQLIKFPDRTTTIGQMINSYLQQSTNLEDHAIHLLFAANRWEAMPRIRDLLESGVTLVVDRYSFSGVAYTAAKPGFSVKWCQQPEQGLLRPDCVFYLTLSPEVAASRGDFGTERYEKQEFQAKAAANFDKLKDDTWTVINADKGKDELSAEILKQAQNVIESARTAQLEQLWVS